MFNRTLIVLTSAILLSAVSGYTQQESQLLPRHLSQEELNQAKDYQTPIPEGTINLSTLGNTEGFRTMAEWEELQAVVITWTSFSAILAEIVRAVRQECEVIIVCSNKASVQNYLTGKGVDWSSNVSFLEGPYNSIWIRDYGPNSVYQNNVDSLFLVDWIYNRPRPKDDVVPSLVGTFMNLPVLSTATAPEDLVHTGGNFMSDGQGIGFSSLLVMEENGPNNTYGFSNHTEEEVDEIMYSYMGIDLYVKMTNLPYDLIHHIDMHMKLIDEETMIVGEYPQGIADGPQIEANLEYILDNFTTKWGTPFRVIRVPMPPDGQGKFPHQGGDYWTYSNALIANRTVIVPTYSLKYDTTALRIWREAMPGYTVTGIDCQAIIPLSGALHCITKEVGVNDPLRIVHQRIDGTSSTPAGYEIDALIQHRSGIASATLFYSSDTMAGYISVSMNPTGEEDHFHAFIPVFSEGIRVYYYIAAEATNGKSQQRPMTAPHGYWTFLVPESSSIHPEDQQYQWMKPVFPNPANAMTCIPVESPGIIGQLDVTLVDIVGRKFQLFAGEVNQDAKKVFLNAQDYPPGLYQVVLTSKAGREVQSLIIQE